jgi:endoglucanase
MAKKAPVDAVPQAEVPNSAGRFVFPLLPQTPFLTPLQLGISSGVYTAAGSQALFSTSNLSWCGSGCGTCYQLTSTGTSPDGAGGDSGESIIVMITNLCPNNGNAQWCPAVGGTNEYGYSYHFDIQAQSEVFGDNPIVDFEEVSCPSAASSDYATCQCA